MNKMTCTEALAKLKLLDKKIEDAMSKTVVGVITYKSKPVFPLGIKDEKEFKNYSQGTIDQVLELIKLRNKLKSALAESNAKTDVVISGVSMKVVEAIEKKNSIKYYQKFYTLLKNNMATSHDSVKNTNERVVANADTHTNKALGENPNHDARPVVRAAFIKDNEMTFISSEKLESSIKMLEKEITDFMSDVDVALSISNSNTFIEI